MQILEPAFVVIFAFHAPIGHQFAAAPPAIARLAFVVLSPSMGMHMPIDITRHTHDVPINHNPSRRVPAAIVTLGVLLGHIYSCVSDSILVTV
jgi:hypothetical protein